MITSVVDVRTILFLLFVFSLGAMNDWVFNTLKKRHPELNQLLPKLFGHKLFLWAAAGVLVAYSLAKGLTSRQKICEQNIVMCKGDGIAVQYFHVVKLGIMYVLTHLEVILAGAVLQN
jgi:hypothetical protein